MSYLLFLPAEFIKCSLQIMNTSPQCVVGGRLLCRQVVVCLLDDVVVCLAKTPRVGHLGVSSLLVVPAEVLPLLRRCAPVSVESLIF